MIQHTDDTKNILFDAVAELGKLLGLSKSASLALALLFTADTPLSLDEVAEYTCTAKSSISMILKKLEHMGLTEVVDKPHDRHKFYQMVDSPADAIAVLIARRLENVTTRQQPVTLPDQVEHSPQYEIRLEQLQEIYQSLSQLAAFLHMRRAAAWQDMCDRLDIDAPGS